MSGKDRPFKSYRSPMDRPFKTYKPGGGSVLFQEPDNFRLPMSLAGKMPNSSNPHQQPQTLPNLPHQQMQVYGNPNDDFTRIPSSINPSGIPGAMLSSLDSSLNQYYNDLGLDDDNMMRPEMHLGPDSLLQHREQDLNIPSSTSINVPGSMSMFGRNMMRGGAPPNMGSNISMSESLSMLFDQPTPSPLASSLPNHQKASNGMGSHTNSRDVNSDRAVFHQNNSDLSLTPTGISSSSNVITNGDLSSPTASEGGGLVQTVIKQEPDDNSNSGFHDNSNSGFQSLSSPSPITSPSTTSDADSIEPRRGVKRPSPDSNSQNDKDNNIPGPSSSKTDQPKTHVSTSAISPGDNKADKEKMLDPAYIEKRRKNNESAKRSREARRTKEEMVALRVVTLEEENMRLRAESSLLEKELDELRHRLFN